MELQENINRIKSLINVISEQNTPDDFASLNTLGITDTGLRAPFTDEPKIASGIDPISISERKPSTISKNENLRRPWGDPYIYYKANDGKYYAYKCGKEAKDKIKPCPAIKKEDWKDANPYKEAIERLVFTNNSGGGNTPTPPPSPTPNTSGSDTDKIKNEYRKKFYDFFAKKIAFEGPSNIKQYPYFPEYKLKHQVGDVVNGVKEEEISLVSIEDPTIKELLKQSIDGFSEKYKKAINTLDINGSKYLLTPYQDNPATSNQLFGLSEIFKPSGEYDGHADAIVYSRTKGTAISKVV
jgi:hypothetical protein